jgi:hypothetical protein
MGRAVGKHKGRRPASVAVDPESPEGRQLGMSPRTQGVPSPIPGGRPHIGNAPVVRQQVPIEDAKPEYRDLNAHGVPPGSGTTRERAEAERGPNTIHNAPPQHHQPVDKPHPIPVYVVQDSGPTVIRSAAPRHFTLPAASGAAAGDPVRICGRDHTRTEVMLLNESTSSDIRFAQRPDDLTNGGGGLLPWPANSYVTVKTQDELYAISKDTGTPTISVIQIYERKMGAE